MRDSDTVAVLEQLQQQQLLTANQMTTIAEEARTGEVSLLDLIAQRHLVDQEKLAEVYAQVVGLPYVNLVDQEILGSVLEVITHDIADSYKVVPWAKDGNVVSVGMMDPHDYKAIEALDFIARNKKLQLKYFVISEASLKSVMRHYDNLGEEVAELAYYPYIHQSQQIFYFLGFYFLTGFRRLFKG